MWKLKSQMQSDANTRTFFFDTAWGESRLFQAGCASIVTINATPFSLKILCCRHHTTFIGLFASVAHCKREYPAVSHASIHPVHCKRKYPAVSTCKDPSCIDCSCQYQANTSPEASRTSGSGSAGTVEAADGAAVEWAAGVTGAAAGCGNRD